MNLTKSNEKQIIPSSAREHASKQESLKENFLCWSPLAVIRYQCNPRPLHKGGTIYKLFQYNNIF